MPKKEQAAIVNDLAERYPMVVVAQTLDKLKEAGFHWATRSGITIAIADVLIPPNKAEILDRYEKQAEKIEKKYQRGLLDRRRAHRGAGQDLEGSHRRGRQGDARSLPEVEPDLQHDRLRRPGNMIQMRTLAGMKGLVANPKGEFIPRPIKSYFREGLSVLEYFISTHGARKGLADTALRTADSGYLTRRLVDVSQDVIVREHDCGTERGVID